MKAQTEETVRFSELQIFLWRVAELLPGLGFNDGHDAGFRVILDELQDRADKGTLNAVKVKDALGRLRVILQGGDSKTVDAALEEIDRLVQSIG